MLAVSKEENSYCSREKRRKRMARETIVRWFVFFNADFVALSEQCFFPALCLLCLAGAYDTHLRNLAVHAAAAIRKRREEKRREKDAFFARSREEVRAFSFFSLPLSLRITPSSPRPVASCS